MNPEKKIEDLSPHLFWDIDRHSLTIEHSSKIIIERVLDYGLKSDWDWIVSVYGTKKIVDTALFSRNLSKTSISFLSRIFNIQKENFACYKNNQLTNNFLNY
jgi:hypothetical protein